VVVTLWDRRFGISRLPLLRLRYILFVPKSGAWFVQRDSLMHQNVHSVEMQNPRQFEAVDDITYGPTVGRRNVTEISLQVFL